MLSGADFPTSGRMRLSRAQVPSCLLNGVITAAELDLVDIDIDSDSSGSGAGTGIITAVSPHGTTPSAPNVASIDLGRRQVWPGLIDLHTHLDKSHIWPRRDNPDGSFASAVAAAGSDREDHWTPQDIRARMDFSLRCAYAHGTTALRTHLDSAPPQQMISWPVFAELRAAWAGRITLQAVSLIGSDTLIEQPERVEGLADLVASYGGVLGAVTSMIPGLETALRRLFALAAERGLDLDFHADESLAPNASSLALIAALTQELGFPGRVTVGHCCSLSVQPPDQVAATLSRVKAAALNVVSLPLCNLYLQDRAAGRTPRRRGVTLLHELAAHGIPVALASDNVRDPFYGYGDFDLLEVFTQSVRIAQLDRPIGAWPAAVARTPARVMGLTAGVIAAGAPADLIICEGRGFDELLARPQARRVVLRAGQVIDSTPPDYCELDHLFGTARC